MSGVHEMELITERGPDGLRLLSPAVGEFTCARAAGELLSSGSVAGVLVALGRSLRLVVPADVEGRVRNERPERVHQPVGYRELLYELSTIEAGAESAQDAPERADALGLVVRSEQSGRFYQRPSPDEPAYLEAGSELTDGVSLGLIEVMKTFAVVPYRAVGGLPERGRVKRYLALDGAEVARGDPLVELE